MIKIIKLFLAFSIYFSVAHCEDASEEKSIFTLESELSVVVSGGNSKFQTYNLNNVGKFFLFKHIISVSGHYTLGKAGESVVARNWDFKLRYDRKFGKKYTGYLSSQVEADKYSGIESRSNNELGVTRKLIESEKFSLISEFAYRYSREKQISNIVKKQSLLRFYIKAEKKFNDGLTANMWVEYLPNLSESENFLVSLGPSILVRLNDMLTLKFSHTGKYDNLPAKEGNKKFDFTNTTSLIAKF